MRWELWGFWRVEGLDKENRGQGTGKNREEQGRTGKNRQEQGRFQGLKPRFDGGVECPG